MTLMLTIIIIIDLSNHWGRVGQTDSNAIPQRSQFLHERQVSNPHMNITGNAVVVWEHGKHYFFRSLEKRQIKVT